MDNSKITICWMILILCIIISTLIIPFNIIYRKNYKVISYSIIPIIIGIAGLSSSYSSNNKK